MSDRIKWNKDTGVEVFSELSILMAAVLLGIHINKWGVISNNLYISIIAIIFFVLIGVGLRSSLKKN